MSAIFGFTFHIGRMTEVLTPDIYRAHCLWFASSMLCQLCYEVKEIESAAKNVRSNCIIFLTGHTHGTF